MMSEFPDLSPYNFNFNDPVNYTDPSGLCPTCGNGGAGPPNRVYSGGNDPQVTRVHGGSSDDGSIGGLIGGIIEGVSAALSDFNQHERTFTQNVQKASSAQVGGNGDIAGGNGNGGAIRGGGLGFENPPTIDEALSNIGDGSQDPGLLTRYKKWRAQRRALAECKRQERAGRVKKEWKFGFHIRLFSWGLLPFVDNAIESRIDDGDENVSQSSVIIDIRIGRDRSEDAHLGRNGKKYNGRFRISFFYRTEGVKIKEWTSGGNTVLEKYKHRNPKYFRKARRKDEDDEK
jgi:hypothetical protein